VESVEIPVMDEKTMNTTATKFFQELINQEEGAILWYCTAGKDRAGFGTVLLLWSTSVATS
jgi:protein-tyrosine phosphatase